jgi:hypothetical protein
VTLIPIRRLNEAGLHRLRALLESCLESPGRDVDFGTDILPILTGPETSTHTPMTVEADAGSAFPRRFDMAQYLCSVVPRLGLVDPLRDAGLWAWFALLWFEQLSRNAKGELKIGELARWLPEVGNGLRYYRHLVLGPYVIFSTNQDRPERALALLHNAPHTPGEVVGQLAATQDVTQSKAAMGVATRLYYDNVTHKLRSGSGGVGPGSARRLRTVLNQLDRTFDLQSLTEDGLYALLPDEFKGGRGRRK